MVATALLILALVHTRKFTKIFLKSKSINVEIGGKKFSRNVYWRNQIRCECFFSFIILLWCQRKPHFCLKVSIFKYVASEMDSLKELHVDTEDVSNKEAKQPVKHMYLSDKEKNTPTRFTDDGMYCIITLSFRLTMTHFTVASHTLHFSCLYAAVYCQCPMNLYVYLILRLHVE